MKNVEVIETILKNSAVYTCGNVDYETDDDRVLIFPGSKQEDTKSNYFFPIENVCSLFLAFSQFVRLNEKKKRIELIVF